MNEAMKRAHDYASIFINAGDRWPDYVPVDAINSVTEHGVTVGDVVMERAVSGGGWRLTQGDTAWVVKSATKESA
jgi:hypothetical protein